MTFQTLKTLDLTNKTVLLRADLNVPMKDGVVSDFTRINRVKPTIEALKAQNAKIVILSHFGRPKGETNPKFSLNFLAPVLSERWGIDMNFAGDCIGDIAKDAIKLTENGSAVLLENVRFHAGEEKNDPVFAAQLAELGDAFVNDAFSTAHRAHASTEGLAHILPTAAGLLMEAELTALQDALEAPQKPVMAIVGGAKISTKLALLNNLVKKVDKLALGGGMANTFMYAGGTEIGKSLCEKDMASEAREIMKTAQAHGCEILLPIDRMVVKEFGQSEPPEVFGADNMPSDQESLDIGPATIEMLKEELMSCKTVLWNGPMGVFEVKPFDMGTNEVAKAVAALTKSGDLISVAGGGDTVSALDNAGVVDDFTYISTAGGAFLEWLEGKTLPGVAALEEAARKAA